MERYINWVNSLNKNQLIGLAIEQRKTLGELGADLESQMQLNRNLIRISKERKNIERKIPAKAPGFQIIKWSEINQIVSGNEIHCFKIRVLTPYEVRAFNYRDLNLMKDTIVNNVTELIGKFAICQPNEVRTNIYMYSETNWVWNITFEADIERDRIDMNLYCSKMPVIDFNII